MGFGFLIEYKRGRENKAIDELSRRDEIGEEFACMAVISFLTSSWLVELKQSYEGSVELFDLLKRLEANQEVPKGFSLQQGLILKKGRIVLNSNYVFKGKALRYVHENPQVGYSGSLRTYH